MKRHIKKLEDVPENTFISPIVIIVKKDRKVKLTFDSRKLNDNCKKKDERNCETWKIPQN